MATPLPPVVSGPITPLSTQVYVDNVLPNSVVTVYNDAASSHQVGTATSISPGAIWVKVSGLAVGQPITARQTYTGSDPNIKVTGISGPSNESVPVQAVPNPLPSPVYVSGLCTCMDSVLMDGLIPGATLTIVQGTNTLVHAPVTQTPQWFSLANLPIPNLAVLMATQTGPSVKPSPSVPSLPVIVAPALQSPDIAPPLRACQTSLDLSNVTPGADLTITNGTATASITNPWNAYTLTDVPPLQAGLLSVEQFFTRCQDPGGPKTAKFTVSKQPPTFPAIGYELCSDVTQLSVSGLIAGEVLTVELSYTSKSGAVLTSLGSQGISGSTATVDLPPHWYPTDAVGPVSLRIVVMLCDQALPSPGYTAVTVGPPPAPYKPPTLPAELYDCARSIQILGAHPGSMVQVFSNPGAVPRSNILIVTAADFTISLWTPLVTGDQIYVKQYGCGVSGVSTTVTVSGVPDQLLPPSVVTPVRPGAATVLAAGVYAGAQVYLYVNKILRSHVDAVGATATLPAGSPALVAGDSLTVQQAICAEISGMSAPAIVTPAPVKPLAPIDLVPKNGAAFVSSTALLSFRDPGSGTPAAAGMAYFFVSQNNIIIGPAISATETRPPFGSYKWPVAMPNGIVTLSVWFLNSAGTGPESKSSFTVGEGALTPTLTVATPLGGSKFEVEGGGFSDSVSVTITANGVLGTVPPQNFSSFTDSGGGLNQEIDCSSLCASIGGGQLQIWATDPVTKIVSNVLLVNCS